MQTLRGRIMENLGRIHCVVDVGENSIEIDPYVVDFFFEPVFLSGMYPDMKCTAQVIGLEGENPPLIKVDICLLYTSPSPRDRGCSRMPSCA